MVKALTCPYCQRSFIDADARYHHARVKHKGSPTKEIMPDNVKIREKAHARNQRADAKRLRERDDEPSLAEIAIEATWKHAAGISLDPFEESLLP